jgi:hypothetical protein
MNKHSFLLRIIPVRQNSPVVHWNQMIGHYSIIFTYACIVDFNLFELIYFHKIPTLCLLTMIEKRTDLGRRS